MINILEPHVSAIVLYFWKENEHSILLLLFFVSSDALPMNSDPEEQLEEFYKEKSSDR